MKAMEKMESRKSAALESDGAPSESSSMAPLSLTPDQLTALGFTGGQEVGKEITVKLRAGELADDGSQSFEIINDDNEQDVNDEAVDKATGEAEGPPNLGYDFGAAKAARKRKMMPPVAASTIVGG